MEYEYHFSILPCLLSLLMQLPVCDAQTYDDTMAIHRDKLAGDRYRTEIRPLNDQSRVIFINIKFELMSIVEVDEVKQSFVCNGFLVFTWTDERLWWDPANYSWQNRVHPLPQDIWRPRVVILNTLGERDLFRDDKAPVDISSNGQTVWIPGSLFPAACEIDMTNFPFDKQNCTILVASMTLARHELQFVTSPNSFGIKSATVHEEWDLVDRDIIIRNITTNVMNFSSVKLTFILKRRPKNVLLTIIYPMIFLSFLNLLVFFIPVNSGEKVTYGVTVLMSLTVFMSLVSNMLPRSSLEMPRVTVYVFTLLIISVLTVINSIIIEFLYYVKEKSSKQRKMKKFAGKEHWSAIAMTKIMSAGKKADENLILHTKQEQAQDDESKNILPPDIKPPVSIGLISSIFHSESPRPSDHTRGSGPQPPAQPPAEEPQHEGSGEEGSHETTSSAFDKEILALSTESDVLSSDSLTDINPKPQTPRTSKPNVGDDVDVPVEICVQPRSLAKPTPRPKKLFKVNKYKLIGDHIDLFSFMIFFMIWVVITARFLFEISI